MGKAKACKYRVRAHARLFDALHSAAAQPLESEKEELLLPQPPPPHARTRMFDALPNSVDCVAPNEEGEHHYSADDYVAVGRRVIEEQMHHVQHAHASVDRKNFFYAIRSLTCAVVLFETSNRMAEAEDMRQFIAQSKGWFQATMQMEASYDKMTPTPRPPK